MFHKGNDVRRYALSAAMLLCDLLTGSPRVAAAEDYLQATVTPGGMSDSGGGEPELVARRPGHRVSGVDARLASAWVCCDCKSWIA